VTETTVEQAAAEASMPRFAFYGRVSTEDQQDPESSRSWQLHRSHQLIQPHGGILVAEYFDCGHSRSLPWKRRPEASRLLAALRHPDRNFTAVVIGEPQRAFYGNQFSLTFPIFTHYGVELWVPEVGGRIDPGSDAHDLVMTLFGGMSKGERNRVKTRVRSAMAAQTATQGRFLGGRPPYGYRLVDAGHHPHPAKAALGGRLHRLEPDPLTAPVVERIFREYLEGRGYYAIAERLTADGVPSPAGHDWARNPHRHGRAWGKSAVRAILGNPRYTGYQVWGRQRRDEVLLDVDDVAAGHTCRRRWNPASEWIWSAEPAHQPLVSRETFQAVQAGMKRASPSKPRKARPEARVYPLRGRLRCQLCDRRLQGQWIRGEAYYRCRSPVEYASAAGLDHPRSVTCGRSTCCPGSTPGWAG
jgi:DNA invertase Pin-like site-specific DNA recombinase